MVTLVMQITYVKIRFELLPVAGAELPFEENTSHQNGLCEQHSAEKQCFFAYLAPL